jgi:hypothetical protein
MLFIQRFGFQDTLNLHATAQAVDGIPAFSATSSLYSVESLMDAQESPVSSTGESPAASAGESPFAPTAYFPSFHGGGTCSELAALELMLVMYDESLNSLADVRPLPPPQLDGSEAYCTCRSQSLHHLSADQSRILWHQRLGHLNSRAVYDLYKAVDGVPKTRLADDLEKCPVCLHAKLTKANRGKTPSRTATTCSQGISIDFGFVVQDSADSARYQRLQGLNGETCYCLITDHFSGTLYGQCFRSKSPPVDFVRNWLATHAPKPDADVQKCYVRMDQGGELTAERILKLFATYNYEVQITGSSGSTMNGAGEIPHRTISRAMRAMLAGAKLPPKFWPYCFAYILRLYNLTVHEGHTQTPYELCSGKRPNLSYIRTFGCRVYAVPAGPKTHPDKPVSNSCTGIFLGFHKSHRNVLYYDIDTNTVKWTQHVKFDEGMNDLPVADRPPNVKMLLDAAGKRPLLPEEAEIDFAAYPSIDFTSCPFSDVLQYEVARGTSTDPNLGFEFADCDYRLRAYISQLKPSRRKGLSKTLAASLIGSYVVAVNGQPVRSVKDVLAHLSRLMGVPHVEFTLAPEKKAEIDRRPPHLSLRLNDLRHICALQFGSGENSGSIQADIDDMHEDCSDALLSELLQTAEADRAASPGHLPATPEEIALPSLTRRRLMKLSTWPLWHKAFTKQLDDHAKENVLGDPCAAPRGAIILRGQWASVIKIDGKRKARLCADGSKKAQPRLHKLLQTYSSCIETPCMRLFFALAAAEGMYITGADCTNAFQQCPPPEIPLFLRIDEAYISWWNDRHPERQLVYARDKHLVLPIQKNLQGLPSAGAAWEKHIGVILAEIGLKATTNEKNLYQGTYKNERVLVCRMTDDFVIGSASPETANAIIDYITSRGVTIRNDGLCKRFNGLDVNQTNTHVKVDCHQYIDKILTLHGWETPQAHETDHSRHIPCSDRKVQELQLEGTGPTVGSPEHAALAKAAGFDYRQVLGEAIYAYVVCRLDIAFAVTFLARSATCPTAKHYDALKHLIKYLRSTKDWGIVYWRDQKRTDLSDTPWVPPVLPANESDEHLPPFPPPNTMYEMVGFVDASHATCLKTRRSVTGMVFMLAGGAVYYKSKLQPTVSTSSTECELIAAVQAAKVAKYLRSILAELGHPQSDPTILYEDNEAAIHVANDVRPTPRTRHVDIGWFAIQEWVQHGDIVLKYINTKINVSDAQTKCLAWVLHRRHCRRAMGHLGHPLGYYSR